MKKNRVMILVIIAIWAMICLTGCNDDEITCFYYIISFSAGILIGVLVGIFFGNKE